MPPKTGRRLSVDERRAELIELGLRIFSEQSYDRVSTVDICKRAGVSKGLLYHYFPTKHDYYLAVLDTVAQEVTAATRPRDDGEGTVEETLTEGIEGFVAYVEARGGFLKSLLHGGVGSDPQAAVVVEQVRETTAGHVFARLSWPRPPATARSLVRAWLAFVEALCLYWYDERGMSRRELCKIILESFQPIAARLAAMRAGPVKRRGKTE